MFENILLSILLLTLSGCYQVTDITDINKSIDFCKDKGGVKDIRVDMISQEYTACVNGDTIFLSEHKIGEDNV